MTYKTDITQDFLKSILDYDPETGVFTWKTRPVEHFKTPGSWKSWNTKYAGKVAGSLHTEGYWCIVINYKQNYAHILAYLWMVGVWPDDEIDHHNRIRNDNRWSNLRLAKGLNAANCTLYSTSTTGYKGVSRCPSGPNFRAQIFINGKLQHIGTFTTAEEAHKAYMERAEAQWGEYASSGK